MKIFQLKLNNVSYELMNLLIRSSSLIRKYQTKMAINLVAPVASESKSSHVLFMVDRLLIKPVS